MKKKIISMFFISMIMLASFSVAVKSDDTKDFGGAEDIVMPSNEKEKLEEFIEENKEGEVAEELEKIKNRVILSDEEDDENININLNELSKVIEEYDYEGIPKNTETTSVNPVDQLINLIISMIEGRLGWVYQLTDKVTTIIQEAKLIWGLSENTVNAALDLYQNAKEIWNLTQYLFNGNISNFTQGWERGFYKTRINNIINDLQYIIDTVPTIIYLINQTINDSTDFVNWINDEPWKNDVYIYGSVNKIEGLATSPIEGVSISCKESSVSTDEEGSFSFTVGISNTSMDSLPASSWYGLHNCTVFAEKDGEIKKTTIPYVFSGGEIYKIFLFKEKDKEDNSYIKTKQINIIQKLGIFFDYFQDSLFARILNSLILY